VNPRRLGQRFYFNVKTFGVGPSLRAAGYLVARKAIDVKILKGITAEMADIDLSLLDAAPFEGRMATRDELQRAASVPEWGEELSADFVDRALAKGDECFALFEGPTLASFGWYSRKPTEVTTRHELHFDPAWVYMYKGFTLPAYRGKRLHGVGMSLACRAYTDAGQRGLISYVEFNNLQSLRSVERMGYRVFGNLYLTRVGGRERAWASPGCRPYQFRLEPPLSTRG